MPHGRAVRFELVGAVLARLDELAGDPEEHRRAAGLAYVVGAALDLADRGLFRLDVPAETARRSLAEIEERRSVA